MSQMSIYCQPYGHPPSLTWGPDLGQYLELTWVGEGWMSLEIACMQCLTAMLTLSFSSLLPQPIPWDLWEVSCVCGEPEGAPCVGLLPPVPVNSWAAHRCMHSPAAPTDHF